MTKYTLILKDFYEMEGCLNYILPGEIFDTEKEAVSQHYYCSDWLLVKGDFISFQEKNYKGNRMITFYKLETLHWIKTNDKRREKLNTWVNSLLTFVGIK
jgi:hypothetical protein